MQPTQPQVVEDWIKYTLEAFQKNLADNNIGVTGKLAASFAHNVIRNSNGNIDSINLKFLYYARFVDMGVGRGKPIGSADLGTSFFTKKNRTGAIYQYKRVPKKWYSRTKTYEIKRLAELMATQFGIQVIGTIENNLDNITYDI